jgi:hypothetical protein
MVWTPTVVAAGWRPYYDGHWIWQDPWGWTWVGAEPWGWAPYHYGRWFVYGSQWYWAPAAPSVAVAYAPAVVGFVGGGPGWSATVAVGGGGYVGWFPLAPHDPFVPWWGSAPHAAVNVTNVTYVNKTYVTVVNQNTFVSGGSVARNAVRDPQIVRQVTSAPVVRGPIPVMPTIASLRVASAAARPAPRPPAVVAQRVVVSRVAPPPAPAPFQAKARVIQENRGAPVAPREAAQLSIQEHGGARASVPIRPASGSPSTGVGLAPRRADVGVRPQAVTAPRGKALATEERPFVSNPTVMDSRRAETPARIVPGAVVPRGADRERTTPPGQQRTIAPPPHAEGNHPAPRAQAPGKGNGNEKQDGKDNKGKDNKKKEPPPPPPSR